MSISESTPASRVDAIVRTLRAAGCVFAEDEARLLIEAAGTPEALRDMVARRVAGLPLEHIVGWVEFCGLRVAVDPGVFVPRQRTGLLVRAAAEFAAAVLAAADLSGSGLGPRGGSDRSAGLTGSAGLVPRGESDRSADQSGSAGLASRGDPDRSAGATVVDLACGSGAVGVAVATLVGRVALHAVDIEPAAVRCAARNLAPLGGHVYAGDLYEPLPARLRGHVDVLVANVPYVPTAAVELMPREAREHEPLVTLDGGADGLDVLRRVAGGAGDWLAPGGHLLVEIGEDQSEAALAAFTGAGLAADVVADDRLHAWVVVGRR